MVGVCVTNRRFPVAGTNLTVPWEVAEQVWNGWDDEIKEIAPTCSLPLMKHWEAKGGFTETELDTWYGKHWREVAE